jgi:hypothetical protein
VSKHLLVELVVLWQLDAPVPGFFFIDSLSIYLLSMASPLEKN